MKPHSSATIQNILKGSFTVLSLFTFLLVQGCDGFAGRDAILSALDDNDLQSKLVISDNGAVLATGPVEKVARQSFDLAGVTFAVTAKTSLMDDAGTPMALSSLDVGMVLEVDGTQNDDGTYEATFAEAASAHDRAAGDVDGDEAEEDEGDQTKVLICHIPPGNPDNARTKEVGASSAAAHLAHGDTEGECIAEPDGSQGDDGEEGDGVDDGDDNDDGVDDDGEKVTICHIPPGNAGNAKTKSIGLDDLQDHLDHGDHEGECDGTEVGGDHGHHGIGGDDDGEEGDDDDDDGEKVTICHIPPGNPDNAKTRNVDLDDLQDHLDHGDTEGPCGG